MSPEKTHRNKEDRKLVAVCLVFFVALILIRLLNILSITPEYDELWTVQHYMELSVSDVFFDLSSPNNHVLNTLGVKFFGHLIPNRNLAMRMTSLLAFCGLCALLFQAVRLLLKNNTARGVVLAVVLLDGLILHFAEVSRGYSLQNFFVFGMFLSLFRYSGGAPENRMFNAWMWFCCALGCCFSISSGIIYVAVVTGVWGILHVPFRSGLKSILAYCGPLIPAFVCWSAISLTWFGINFSRFAQARAECGEDFNSLMAFGTYCVSALLYLGILWTLPCLAAGWVWLRGKAEAWRMCAFGIFTVVLLLASALVTKGTPLRVYVPLVPISVFCAGIVLDELLRSRPSLKRFEIWLFLLVFALCAFLSEGRRRDATAPDLIAVFDEVSKLDSGIFATYEPMDTYVMLMLFEDDLREDNLRRMESPGSLLALGRNALAVARIGAEDVERLPLSARPSASGSILQKQDYPYWLYRLLPYRPGDDPAGKMILCFATFPLPEETAERIAAKFGFVNGILTSGSTRQCLAASGDTLTADELLELERSCPGRLSFRVVGDGAGPE